MCGYFACMYICELGAYLMLKEVLDPFKLAFKEWVTIWVLGIEPGSSDWTVSAVNNWAIFPGLPSRLAFIGSLFPLHQTLIGELCVHYNCAPCHLFPLLFETHLLLNILELVYNIFNFWSPSFYLFGRELSLPLILFFHLVTWRFFYISASSFSFCLLWYRDHSVISIFVIIGPHHPKSVVFFSEESM